MVQFSVSLSLTQKSHMLMQRLIVKFRAFSGEMILLFWLLFMLLLVSLKLFPNEEVLFKLGSNFRDTLINGQIKVLLNFNLLMMMEWPLLVMIATFVVRGRRVVVNFCFMRLEATLIMSRLWNLNMLLCDVFKFLSNWLSVLVNNRLRLDAKMGVKSAHLSVLILLWLFNAVEIVGLVSAVVLMEVVLALGERVAKVVSASFVILFESVEFFGDVVLAIRRR